MQTNENISANSLSENYRLYRYAKFYFLSLLGPFHRPEQDYVPRHLHSIALRRWCFGAALYGVNPQPLQFSPTLFHSLNGTGP